MQIDMSPSVDLFNSMSQETLTQDFFQPEPSFAAASSEKRKMDEASDSSDSEESIVPKKQRLSFTDAFRVRFMYIWCVYLSWMVMIWLMNTESP